MDLFLRNLVFCSCFLLISSKLIIAQDTLAHKILDQSRETFLNVEDFSADLLYSLYVHPTQREPDNGKIMYKDKHFFIQLGKQKIFCDGNTQWEYSPAYSEVRVFDHDPYQGIGLIFKIFLEGQKLKYLGERILNNRKCDLIAITSLPGNKYDYARVWIDQEHRLPSRIYLSSPTLTEVYLTFSEIVTNQGLEDARFHFDLKNYPNIRMIDERTAR